MVSSLFDRDHVTPLQRQISPSIPPWSKFALIKNIEAIAHCEVNLYVIIPTFMPFAA